MFQIFLDACGLIYNLECITQLTLEQHGFELCWSTYTYTDFFPINIQPVLQICVFCIHEFSQLRIENSSFQSVAGNLWKLAQLYAFFSAILYRGHEYLRILVFTRGGEAAGVSYNQSCADTEGQLQLSFWGFKSSTWIFYCTWVESQHL